MVYITKGCPKGLIGNFRTKYFRVESCVRLFRRYVICGHATLSDDDISAIFSHHSGRSSYHELIVVSKRRRRLDRRYSWRLSPIVLNNCRLQYRFCPSYSVLCQRWKCNSFVKIIGFFFYLLALLMLCSSIVQYSSFCVLATFRFCKLIWNVFLSRQTPAILTVTFWIPFNKRRMCYDCVGLKTHDNV